MQRRLHRQLVLMGVGVVGDETLGFRALLFRGLPVESRDLWCLRWFPEIDHLSLARTKVNDEVVRYVRHLKQLRLLNLQHTGVSFEAMARLKLLLPKCRIIA